MSRDFSRRSMRVVFAFAMAMAGAAALVWACGPWVEDIVSPPAVRPAYQETYARGEIGIVRPTFARRYLLYAYRMLSGQPPLAESTEVAFQVSPERWPDRTAADAWAHASALALGLLSSTDRYVKPLQTERNVPGSDYQQFDNCLHDSFVSAVRTLEARQARYGAGSLELREWTRAQIAVFQNCGNTKTLVLPQALPATADPLLRADREYQIAAAHFYGMEYEEAARRFRTIASDRTSPWRPYGRYLVARSRIRAATLTKADDPHRAALFNEAETELKAVVADPEASALHESAKGLLLLVEDRYRPMQRLRVLAKTLTTATAARREDFQDYTRLMDRFIGDTVEYSYTDVTSRAEIVATDEANDWVLAIQGAGQAAVDRAVERWQDARSLPWLVAVLWKVPANHQVVPRALEAAAAVDARSPGYPTVAFLRVRLLARAGRRAEARALLDTLPREVDPVVDPDTVNLFTAERAMLADTLEEFLANAARISLGADVTVPVLDADAGDIFTYRLPLNRLIAAGHSTTLPGRIRLRVGIAALSRAVVLRREEEGGRSAAIVRALAPAAMHVDLDRYVNASSGEERRRAGVLLMLRTPGMHAYVRGPDDNLSVKVSDPSRAFDHTYRRNWWCFSEQGQMSNVWIHGYSALQRMLYGHDPVPPPAFITADEAVAAERELQQLRRIGNARDYLAAEAIEWAQAMPSDINAAEALALAVEGGRWNECSDDSSAALSRRAFQTLHRLFPRSEWARRTKYWYR